MRIDPKVEQVTRDAFNLALKRRLEEVPAKLNELGDDAAAQQCVELCMLIAGYVCVDVCGNRVPSTSGLNKLIENMVEVTESFTLDPRKLDAYLSRVVFGRDTLVEVFPDQQDAMYVPLLTAASMIVTFCPKGQTPWQYMDAIEQATEAVTELPTFTLPAAVFRGARTAIAS